MVSTSETPEDIDDIDATAKLTRKFNTDTDTLKTRKIYIGWTDEYSTTKYNTFRDAIPTGDDRQHLVTQESHYTNIPWIMKANSQYYLHIYYDGATKTLTKAFKTPDYPSTLQEAENMFSGNAIGALFNTGLTSIERKNGEPIAQDVVAFNPTTNVAFSMLNDTGNVLAQYVPGFGFVGTDTHDYIYFW